MVSVAFLAAASQPPAMLIMNAPIELLQPVDVGLLQRLLSCVTVHVYTRKPLETVAAGAAGPMPKLVAPSAKFLQ